MGAQLTWAKPLLQPFIWYVALLIHCNSSELHTGPSEMEIWRHLTLEEKDEIASATIDSNGDFTEMKYLLYGLGLEEQQWALSILMLLSVADVHTRRKLKHTLLSTTLLLPPTSIIEKRTSFCCCLIKFRQLQAHYQPEVTPLLAQLPLSDPTTSPDTDSIHNILLLLPSSLPPDIQSKCLKRLTSMEKELHIGQCRDSLSQLWTKLMAQA